MLQSQFNYDQPQHLHFAQQQQVSSAPLTINTQLAMPQVPVAKKRGEHLNFNANVTPFFKPTKQLHNVYSVDKSRIFTLRIIPKIDRGFFLAENEWTCYRRNYFQLSTAFSATDSTGREIDYPAVVEVDGQCINVTGFSICVAARVASGEKKIELVQHTPKRDKGPQIIPTPKPLKSGGNPHQYNGMGSNPSVITFERMQFKTATANNGKRRAAQQFYVLLIELFAIKEDGSAIKIAMAESNALVVRGRSPGHYIDVQQERLAAANGAHSAVDMDSNNEMVMTPISPYVMSAYPSMMSPVSSNLSYPSSTRAEQSSPYLRHQSFHSSPIQDHASPHFQQHPSPEALNSANTSGSTFSSIDSLQTTSTGSPETPQQFYHQNWNAVAQTTRPRSLSNMSRHSGDVNIMEFGTPVGSAPNDLYLKREPMIHHLTDSRQ